MSEKNQVLAQRQAMARLAKLKETRPQAEDRARDMIGSLGFDPSLSAIVASTVLDKHEKGVMRKLAFAAGIDEEFAIGKDNGNEESDEVREGHEAPEGFMFGDKDSVQLKGDLDLPTEEDDETSEEEAEEHEGQDVQLEAGKELLVTLPNGLGTIELSYESGDEDDEVEDEDDDEDEDVNNFDSLAQGVDEMAEKEAARRNFRREIVAKALDSIKPRDIGQGGNENTGVGGKKSGDRRFKMNDGYAVSSPSDETGASMKLKGDSGSEVVEDLDFFAVPTASGAELLNSGAHPVMKMKNENRSDSDLGDVNKQLTDIPSSGKPVEGVEAFEVPTKSPQAAMRKVTVAQNEVDEVSELEAELTEVFAGAVDQLDENLVTSYFNAKEELVRAGYVTQLFRENEDPQTVEMKIASKACDAYGNGIETGPMAEIECGDCHAHLVLSQKAYDDGSCPGCQALRTAARDIAIEAKLRETPEMVKGNPNQFADGFLAPGTQNRKPVHRNSPKLGLDEATYEDERTASLREENERFRNALIEHERAAARREVATRVAVRLHERGLIEAQQLDQQIEQLSTMPVNGIEMVAKMMEQAANNTEKLLAFASRTNGEGINRQASVEGAGGVLRTFAMPTANTAGNDLASSLKYVLNANRYNDGDFDESGSLIRRSRR